MALKVKVKSDELSTKEPDNYYNNVSYDVGLLNEPKLLKYRKAACYSGIWSDVVSLTARAGDASNPVCVDYYCHVGHLAVRLPLIEFIARRFSHYFQASTLFISDGEPVVSVVCKPDTPLEMVYGLGSFLRLTWEQYSPKHRVTDGLAYVVDALHDNYTIHIPTLYFNGDARGDLAKLPDERKQVLVTCMFHMLRYYNIFTQPLRECHKLKNTRPLLQDKMFRGLWKTAKFRQNFPEFSEYFV